MTALIKTGKRGTLVIPSQLRKKMNIHEGEILRIEEKDGGIFLQSVNIYPKEIYSTHQKWEFLLSNTVSKNEFEAVKHSIEEEGIDINDLHFYSPWK